MSSCTHVPLRALLIIREQETVMRITGTLRPDSFSGTTRTQKGAETATDAVLLAESGRTGPPNRYRVPEGKGIGGGGGRF